MTHRSRNCRAAISAPARPRPGGLAAILLLVFLAGFLAPVAQGEYQIEVIKQDVIAIRLPPLGGSEGAEATRILTQDLEQSGLFRIVASGGDHGIEGSASASGCQCKVFKSDGTLELTASGSGDLRRAVHRVADEIVAKLTGRKGIAQTRIAFISDKSGKKGLYVMDYDGAKVQGFGTSYSMVVAPAFSRQGDKIAFTAYRPVYPDVLVMPYPGGKAQAVSTYPGLNSGASFSPDGSRLALTLSKDGNPEIYTLSAGGGGLKRLTTTRGGESSPTWSPDGKRIAYASDEGGRPQIHIIPSSGGRGARLTSSPAYNTEPDWSAESGLIAYSSMRGGGFVISTINPEEEKHEGDVVYADGSCEDPSWAPDGRHLVFSRTVDGHSDLYMLDTYRKEAVQLTRDFGNCTQPAWSGR